MAESKKKEYLFIINNGPYGNERSYNALRMAMNLSKREGTHMRMFLMGDGVQWTVAQQSTPNGITTQHECSNLFWVTVMLRPEEHVPRLAGSSQICLWKGLCREAWICSAIGCGRGSYSHILVL